MKFISSLNPEQILCVFGGITERILKGYGYLYYYKNIRIIFIRVLGYHCGVKIRFGGMLKKYGSFKNHAIFMYAPTVDLEIYIHSKKFS